MASSSRARPSPNLRSSPNVTHTLSFGFMAECRYICSLEHIQGPAQALRSRRWGAPRAWLAGAAGHRERDALGRQRQLGEPHPRGVVGRIGERRRRGHDRGLADAAGAEGAGRRGLLDDDRLDVGKVGRGQLLVVEETRISETALVIALEGPGPRLT